jgi:hypothetical protein
MMISPSLNMAPPFAGGMIRKLTKAPRGFYVERSGIGYQGPYQTEEAATEALRKRPDADACYVTWWRGKPG